MNYSRVLQVEHEQPSNVGGEGAYTIFNLVQPFKLSQKKKIKQGFHSNFSCTLGHLTRHARHSDD